MLSMTLSKILNLFFGDKKMLCHPAVFVTLMAKKKTLALQKLEPKKAELETPSNFRSSVSLMENCYFFECPHCLGLVQVPRNDLNCKIFRHGSYKLPDNPPIPPHLSFEECQRLITENLITGCGKPFLFVMGESNSEMYVEKCGYL